MRQRLGTSIRAIRQALMNPDLRRLEIAWTLAVAAQWALIVALLVYTYDLAGALGVGLLGLARTLPTLIGVPLAATLGDRRSRTRVLRGLYLSALASAIVATIALAVDAGMLAVLSIAAVNAVATTAIRPLQNAMIPGLARSPEEVVAANVASSAGEGIGVFVGPALAGILMVYGPEVVAGAGAVGMALATVAFLAVRRNVVAQSASRGTAASGAPDAGHFAGLHALRSMPTQLLFMGVFGIQPLVRGALTVLIVVASIDLLGLGDPGVGLLNAAIGAGGIIGAAGTVLLVGRARLAGVLALALVMWGAPISVMGAVPVAWVAMLAMGVVGIANAVLDVTGYTLMQRTIPNDVRSSILGLFEGYVAATAAIGGIVAPVLILVFGIQGALVVTGLVLPLAAAVTNSRLGRADDITLVPARRAELLRSVPMFAPLPMTKMEELACRLQPLDFEPGELLMQAGQTGDRFVLIDSGSVEVERGGATLRTIGPGGFCGEIALLRSIPRTATVRALTHGSGFSLDGADFIAAITGERDAVRTADRLVDARISGREPGDPAEGSRQ